MKKSIIIVLSAAVFGFSYFALAYIYFPQQPSQVPPQNITSAFRYYKNITGLNLNAPSVVEVPLSDIFFETDISAVQDVSSDVFEPSYFIKDIFVTEIPLNITTSPSVPDRWKMTDNNLKTFVEFGLSESGVSDSVKIFISTNIPVTASSFTVILDDFVALPNFVEIKATNNSGKDQIVMARKRMDSQTVRFPKTTSNFWTVVFVYSQPLRIRELKLFQENAPKISNKSVRFLAQPGRDYRVYFAADRFVDIPAGESGNLAGDREVLRLDNLSVAPNPSYVVADTDKDGVADKFDNCVSYSNPDQLDINGNGRGDACDDFDSDGLVNAKDNCPNIPNRDQADDDGDKIGNVCDGEESRITEKHAWIPWVGIGFAVLVLVTLFFFTARPLKNKQSAVENK
jgi:hypothetical protein